MFGRNCQKKEDSVRKKSGPRKLLFSSSFDDGNFNAECLVTPGSLPVSGSSTTTTTPQAETPPAFRRPNGRRSLGRPFGLSVDRTDGRSGHRRLRRKARRGRSRRAAAALLPACSVARRSLSQSKIEGVARRSSKKKKIMKRGDERRCVRERHNRCRQESQKRKCIALHPFPFPILRRTHSCHHTSVSRR